jgi:UDP-glucuronate decarboxylase
LRDGHEVLGIDNFFTGSEDNIAHLLDSDRFSFIRHDVTLPISLEVEGVFNLACPASPVHYQKNPVETLRTNVLGAVNVLDLAQRTNSRILQASTSEVYGDPTVTPQDEEYWGNVNPIGIRACYDEGKRAAESLFFDYHRQYGVDIRVARIFNTYGPRMSRDDGRVVSNFVVQALSNSPLTLYGNGEQTRSFCYVDDLIEGLFKLFFSETAATPINIGNPTPVSMFELAKEIIDLTGSQSKIVFEQLPQDDPKVREPNIEKAWNALRWRPEISRKEGLQRTIEYFKSH